MLFPPANRAPEPDPGLCESCAHARRVSSSRGSVFVLCSLATADPRFDRYPMLPVVQCAGHERSGGGEPDVRIAVSTD